MAENSKYYLSGDGDNGFTSYFFQPLETDARAFVKERMDQFYNLKLSFDPKTGELIKGVTN